MGDIHRQTRWELTDLFPGPESEEVTRAVDDLHGAVAALEALRPSLAPHIGENEFLEALRVVEQFTRAAHRLEAYGQLWFSEDTQNQSALTFMSRIEQLVTEASNRVLFFTLWWRSLDDSASGRLLAQAGDIRYYLEQLRAFREHTLSEAEEKIINLKDLNGVSALGRLYDVITNKFVFELDVEGEKKTVNRDSLMVFARHQSGEVREAAYKELFRKYAEEEVVLSQIYMHRARDWSNEHVALRKFSTPIAVRNLSNDIPDSVVDMLLEVCQGEAPLFQRYFRLKAGWLGKGATKLRRYDLYAPLRLGKQREIPYARAVGMVLESFHQFSPTVAAQAKRVFDDMHIDSEIRPGKRGGAFCYGVLPGISPWVLLNYTGEPRQVATLAHELGHAVHALMASDHSVLTFHSALPMAETASVFSELLLTDRLLAEEKDAALRHGLLAEAVDDIYATVLRQAFFVLYEKEAHRLVAEGCTAEDLDRLYLANLAAQFGDAVDVSDDFRFEWLGIPHLYHTPFYCYAYSFGQLLSMSLYHRYKVEGAAFGPEFLKILSFGGSSSPGEILRQAGIDMADRGFWAGGFRAIEGMIGALEQ
jgi:oligoendopeptidase F